MDSRSEQNTGLTLNLSHSFEVAAALLKLLVVLYVSTAGGSDSSPFKEGFIDPEIGEQISNF